MTSERKLEDLRTFGLHTYSNYTIISLQILPYTAAVVGHRNNALTVQVC
jgi:hypothetical protein